MKHIKPLQSEELITIYITSKEEWENTQTIAFANGCKWINDINCRYFLSNDDYWLINRCIFIRRGVLTWVVSCTNKDGKEAYITFEQFDKKYGRIMEKEKDMNYIINAKQAQSIIDIACNSWKEELSNKWAKGIVLDRPIEVEFSFYEEMILSCTPPQLKLLNEIFPKRVVINWEKLKIGSVVKLDKKHSSIRTINEKLDFNKPFHMVYFDSPHCIDYGGRFIKNGRSGRYCTFNQEGIFVTYLWDGYKNYIIDIIEE